MDLVTQNIVASFRDEETLPLDINESVLFEHFVNYCVISQNYGEEFDLSDVHLGGGGDLGIDGIAVIINGTLVTDSVEIDDLCQMNKYVDAEFVFSQAKSGANFDGSEISDFFFGVKDLFSSKPKQPRNERVKEKEELIRNVYRKSALFKKGNPRVRMYYVTTGKWLVQSGGNRPMVRRREVCPDRSICRAWP
jgi:hypothetical protein